jgi:MFS superfamily sulfate permease-like transporter
MTNFTTNLKSGIIVFLVALPLCLGIALACNVPLFAGILAGIVGGIFVTIFSGSVLSVSGPAAGLTSIVLASVASLGSYEIFLAAVFFAGIGQLILGFLKAGNAGNFIPLSVIKGMLAGIGIILIMKQLPHLVGYDRDPEGDFEFAQSDGHNTISDLYYMFS